VFVESTENKPEVETYQSPYTHILQLTSRGEEIFERYSGDDIDELTPKELYINVPNPLTSQSTLDANMVTWDGPNDPTNPQNWSVKLVRVIMTVSRLTCTSV